MLPTTRLSNVRPASAARAVPEDRRVVVLLDVDAERIHDHGGRPCEQAGAGEPVAGTSVSEC